MLLSGQIPNLEPTTLLVLQGNHRFYARCSACRNLAPRERNERQRERHANERERVDCDCSDRPLGPHHIFLRKSLGGACSSEGNVSFREEQLGSMDVSGGTR